MATRFHLARRTGRFMAIGLGLAITPSCSKDEDANDYAAPHIMNFGVSLCDEWHTPRKTHAAAETREWSATRFDGGELWITATSEPMGNTALFRSPATRAAAVTTDDFHDSFSLYGYAYKGADWENRTEVTPYFENETVTNQNGIWIPDIIRYWPGSSYRMRFFACAPSDMAATLIIKNYTPVELKYTVPQKAIDQKDLVVVATPVDVPGDHNQNVALDFKHILTAVKVTAAKGMSGTVTEVRLTHLQYQSSYNFSKKEWTFGNSNNTGDASSYDFVLEREVRLDPNAENDTPIADGIYTFMMIPQWVYTSARLVVTIDGTPYEAYPTPPTGRWDIGQCVTYRISKR